MRADAQRERCGRRGATGAVAYRDAKAERTARGRGRRAADHPGTGTQTQTRGQGAGIGIGVKISYAELRLVGEDCWPASGILMNCAGDRDSPRFVSIAKRPCLGRRRVAPTASYEIETRRYADT